MFSYCGNFLKLLADRCFLSEHFEQEDADRHNHVVKVQLLLLLKRTNGVGADAVRGVACVGFHKSLCCAYVS